MNKKIIPIINLNNEFYKNRIPLNYDDVVDAHKWNRHGTGINFNKDLGLKGRYCYHPFNTITVDSAGDVYMCVCQAWLPISVGKIWEFETLEDIVSSVRAREIQASILDGSYRYCDEGSCSLILSNDLSERIDHRPDTVNWINFAIDSSCNLTCPSCRKEFIFTSEGPEFDHKVKLVEHLVKLIENQDHFIKFTLSGDGDPFASLIYRHFLSKLDVKDKSNVEIEIVTNGILAKAHWHKMSGIYNNVVRFKISFDAGSEQVYNITRRGGDWNKLLESSKYMIKWKQKHYSQMQLTSNFVVQQANYKDMLTYVELCDKLGFDEINFQKIDDWGTFSDYASTAVWQPSHPEHEEYLKYFNDPVIKNKKVNLTNLKD